MVPAAALLFFVVVVNSQEIIPARDHRYPYHYHDETPKPYAFNYNAPLDDGIGHSSRTEVADGSGKVEGSYTVTNDEGHTRVVEYVADELGFRANVRTNEPGTESQSPANVNMESTSPFSHSTFNQYTAGMRTPVAPAAVNPLAPVAPLAPIAVAPENVVVPAQPSLYNLPGVYNNRYNPYYRNQYRNPVPRNSYNRNLYNRNPYSRVSPYVY